MTKKTLIKADLHLHTTASDGRLSPGQLVELAVQKGLNVMAVTDHDTVDGIDAALKAASNLDDISIIPGVEISTDVPGMEVHMLGYFIDFKSNKLIDTLNELRDSRVIRAHSMLDKLDKLGMHIEWDKLKELAGDSVIGRPHIARALLEGGYVNSFAEAFDKYIGRNGPAYVEHKKMTPVEVAKLIIEVNGIPVLAHPDNINNLNEMLGDLKPAGLMGIEVYYGKYTADIINRLLGLAKKYELLTTGGSDYHAFHDERETMIGDINIPEESVRKLYSAATRTHSELVNKYKLYLD